MLPLLLVSLLVHSATPAAAGPSFFKPAALFANTSSLANKTAALLATANAKERNIVALLGAKPNSTIVASTVAAYKNLTSGNAVSVVVPSSTAASAPTGTLQCLVNADGIVVGIVGSNGAGLCASAGATSVAIPVGDGYISGLKVAVAKAGPPYVGQLGISVTPRGGGVPTTHWCGFGGGVPATLLSPLQSLALYNFKAGCVPAPQASGRRRLAASGVMDLTSIKIEVSPPPPATADTALPITLQLNSVPVSEAVAPTPTPTPTPAPLSPPSAPAITAATSPSRGLVQVTFTPSSNPGNPPLTNYTIACAPSSGSPTPVCSSSGAGVVTTSVSSSATQGSIANLVGGTSYVCFVLAVSSTSSMCSAASAPVTVTSAPPSAPTVGAVLSPSPGVVQVSFTPSTDLGNPQITGYTVACIAYGGGAIPACATSGAGVQAVNVALNATQVSVPGFVGGTQAVCFVVVNNGVGGNVCSAASSPVTVLSAAPSAPTISSATSTAAGTINVAFTQSMSVGNPPLTGYTIACLPNASPSPACATSGAGVVTASVSSSATSGSITGLVGGTVFVCYVQANAGGGNACSAASSPVTVLPAPTVTPNAANLASSATQLIVTGTGFNPTAAGNTVALSPAGSATVTSATAIQLTLSVSGLTAGPLSAVVTVNGQSSGAPVQVATVIVAQYAYVTDFGANTVFVCSVSSGTLNSCTATGSNFYGPIQVAFSGGSVAFVSDYNGYTVTACTVSGSGTSFTNCATTGSVANPAGIVIVGSTAFIANDLALPWGNRVYACTVSGSTLANCATAASGFNQPYGIAISGNIAFVTNSGGTTVSACAISGPTFNNCTPTGSNFNQPAGIALYGGYAYISNFGDNTVTACVVSGATLTSCSTAASFVSPNGLAVYNGYLYVAELNAGTVKSCSVSGATIGTCTATGSGFSAPSGITII